MGGPGVGREVAGPAKGRCVRVWSAWARTIFNEVRKTCGTETEEGGPIENGRAMLHGSRWARWWGGVRLFVRCSQGHDDGLLVNDAAAFRLPGFPGGGARRQGTIGAAMLPASRSGPGVQGVERFAVGPPGIGRTRPRRPTPASEATWRRASPLGRIEGPVTAGRASTRRDDRERLPAARASRLRGAKSGRRSGPARGAGRDRDRVLPCRHR